MSTPIQPGAVFNGQQARQPYAYSPELRLTDLSQLSAGELAALLSALSSANTASTSELLGAVRMLAAIARAVRSRSYVLMAMSTSESGDPLLCNAANLVSKASVISFTLMGLTFLEVDLGIDGSRTEIDERLRAAVQGLGFVTIPELITASGLTPIHKCSPMLEGQVRDWLHGAGWTPRVIRDVSGQRQRGFAAPAAAAQGSAA